MNKKNVIFTISLLSLSLASLASELINVSVEVKQIIIDNTGPVKTSVSMKSVCKVLDKVEITDVRSYSIQNSIAKKLNGTCKVKYLGEDHDLKLYAGGGVYFDENQMDRFSLTASATINGRSTQTWGGSDTQLNDVFYLTIDTAQTESSKSPKKSENFRISYKFFK